MRYQVALLKPGEFLTPRVPAKRVDLIAAIGYYFVEIYQSEGDYELVWLQTETPDRIELLKDKNPESIVHTLVSLFLAGDVPTQELQKKVQSLLELHYE